MRRVSRPGGEVSTVALGTLLFGSGLCALIYQAVWLRQFRLIFGASTLASAAVLAMFMAGLGVGAWKLGRYVDRSRNPLAFYGFLEVGVAISAAATPLLLWIVRSGYLAMGGSFTLGAFFATVVRLLLTVIVLAIPTVLMGGTLPAVARSLERKGDAGRIGVSILYAANALGAVAGVAVSTFFLLERLGNLRTLIGAALLNALVGMAAIAYSNHLRRPAGKDSRVLDEIEEDQPEELRGTEEPRNSAVAPPRFVYAAAAIVGFVFFLMELVWYRLLTPILGGTTYTFGLILAAALAGIGSGSLFWAAVRRRRATVGAFAVSCAIEALLLAVPFALGDRLAFVALLSRSLGALGFGGYVLSWLGITLVVVFPAAFVAGLQFPLLISLLGEGRKDVGRHVGAAYLWNTAGAIVGSIAGGFGLLPLLTATGAWRAAVVLLCLLVLASWLVKPGKGARVLSLVINDGEEGYRQQKGEGFSVQAIPGKVTPWMRSRFPELQRKTEGAMPMFLPFGANLPAWVIHGQYATRDTITIGGKSFRVNLPAGSFGYWIRDVGTVQSPGVPGRTGITSVTTAAPLAPTAISTRTPVARPTTR